MKFARGGVLPPEMQPVALESCRLAPGEVVLTRRPSEALRKALENAGYVVHDVADVVEDDG